MKIGIISNLYPPYQRGGAEYVVVRTVEALVDMGHDVFVISARPRQGNGSRIDLDSNSSERIYRIWARNVYFVLDDYKHIWPVRLLWHIIDTLTSHGKSVVGEILDEEQPDIVITHNLKGIGLRIPQAIQERSIPHVHLAHDLQLLVPSGLVIAGQEAVSVLARPFYRMYRALCRRAFGSPNLVLFPSSYLEKEYKKEGFFAGSETLVLQNPAPDFQAIKRSQRTPGPLRLLFVGQLEQHKGISFLLDYFDQNSGETQLIIAGEGTMRDEVRKRAKADKRINYLGYISINQLISCLGFADAVVVPSLCYENSPTVIYESLQAGIPVLASDIGGVGELVQNGRNGYLFTPGSQSDFQEKLKALRENKERFFEAQADIQETVAPYAIDTYAKTLVKKLEGIIHDGK